MTKRPPTELAHAPRTVELERHRGITGNPAVIYLETLGKNGRPAMRSALDAIADLISKEHTHESFDWSALMRGIPSEDDPKRLVYPGFRVLEVVRRRLIETYSPRSVNRMLAALRGTYNKARQLGWVSSEASTLVRELKLVPTSGLPPAGRTLELHEIEALYAACGERGDLGVRDAAIVTLLYAGGLRREEAAALDCGRFVPKTGELTVTGKFGKTRTVYIIESYHPGIVPWIEKRAGSADDAPMLVAFWGPKGKPKTPTDRRMSKTGVSHAIRELNTAAKLKPFTPHDLRRSFGTHLLDAGADIIMVQRLMGHANLATTAIYDRRGEKGKREAMAKFPTIKFPTKKGP